MNREGYETENTGLLYNLSPLAQLSSSTFNIYFDAQDC